MMFGKLPLALIFICCASFADAATKPSSQISTTSASAKSGGKFVPAARIAVINPDRIMSECEQMRDMGMDLQEAFVKRQGELAKRAEEFQKMSKEGKITPSEAAKKESELNIDARELQVEFEGRRGDMQQTLVSSLQKATEVVAKKNSIDACSPYFLYAREEVDLSNEIIAEMNRAYRAEKNANKFKAAAPAKTTTSSGSKKN